MVHSKGKGIGRWAAGCVSVALLAGVAGLTGCGSPPETTTTPTKTTKPTARATTAEPAKKTPDVKPVSYRFTAEQFADLTDGSRIGSFVVLFTNTSVFYLPVELHKGLYDISVCGVNSKPGPVELHVINPIDPTSTTRILARFTFSKDDDSISTETQLAKIPGDLKRLEVRFVNDFMAAGGADRNARVYGVTLAPRTTER